MGLYRLADRRRPSHCCLGDVSGAKNGTKMPEILLASVEVEVYPEVVKMLFSSIVTSIIPSSQPNLCQLLGTSSGVYVFEAPLMTLPTPICV